MKFLGFLYWIRQKRQNKDVLASKGKVMGKQTLLLKWHHSDVRNPSTDISKFRIS